MNSKTHEIQRLSDDVINKIAAGEVVQRPGAALKEMMENSIDAHATSISVSLVKGGLKQMEIRDNGDGILKEDLPLLCERYTTSKLKTIDDLNTIATFGFRGEALASISTVSRVLVVTKRRKETCGWKAHYCNNRVIDDKIEPTATTDGTTIIVDDLFYNIPVRQQVFSQSAGEETKFIMLLFQVFSMHYASRGVSFALKQSPNKVLFKSSPCTSIKKSIATVLGASILPVLNEITLAPEDGVECPFSGYLVYSTRSPTLISSSLSFVLFVNDRYIHNARIKQSIWRVLEQYYYCSDTNSRSRNQNLFCYLSITIDSHLVDVNVHPNKKEVCFLDEEYVIQRIVSSLDEELEKVVNTQEIGEANTVRQKPSPTSKLPQDSTGSTGSTGFALPSKKLRVDYSQQSIPFARQPKEAIENSQTKGDGMYVEKRESGYVDVLDIDASESSITTPSDQDKSTLSNPTPLVEFLSETPFRSRDDLNLGSIHTLAELVRNGKKNLSYPSDLLTKSIFISSIKNESFLLIQYSTELYLLKSQIILQEFFYQRILNHFGCFYKIELMNQLCVNHFLSIQSVPHLEESIRLLYSFHDMLNDYFSIEFEYDENAHQLFIKSLPLLLVDSHPFWGYMPVFLRHLVMDVDYGNEYMCLESISRHIAEFYAFLPEESSKEREHYKSTLQYSIYPQIKKELLVQDNMWKNGGINLIASTSRLYHVFERC